MAQAACGAASAVRGRYFGALSLTEDRRRRLAQIWQQARAPQGLIIARLTHSIDAAGSVPSRHHDP